MSNHVPALAQLIAKLGMLPSIGQKTAQRLAFHILSMEKQEAISIAQAIVDACENLRLCDSCCNLTDTNPCSICTDRSRLQNILCVVENPSDITAIENTHEYKGLYHVLHGSINPLNNIGPEHIKLKELISRLSSNSNIDEVILANGLTAEGEATALYIARLIKPANIKVTRIAHGLPVGSHLDLADEITLTKAISGRVLIN